MQGSRNLHLLLFLVLFLVTSVISVYSEKEGIIKQVTGDSNTVDGVVGDVEENKEGEHLLKSEFTSFISRYSKSYETTEEHDYRYKVFQSNFRRAKRNQLLDPSASHGITKFSDLTTEEFESQYLGVKKPRPSIFQKTNPASTSSSSGTHEAAILPTNDLPEDFDWRDYGAVTPVKDQGSCGSCWSFSAAAALEGANYLSTGKLISLSEQQMVDCDHVCDPMDSRSCDAGCNGGLMTNAFDYMMQSGGLESEIDYPYTGADGTCKFDKSKIAASVANFSVISSDEDQIAANLVKYGPLAVGINAAFMQTYIGGVSCPYICFKNYLDHGVLLVGYGASGYSQLRFKNKPYWIIKNSWGASWGEDGYYKICRGNNICGVDSMVSSVAAAS